MGFSVLNAKVEIEKGKTAIEIEIENQMQKFIVL